MNKVNNYQSNILGVRIVNYNDIIYINKIKKPIYI